MTSSESSQSRSVKLLALAFLSSAFFIIVFAIATQVIFSPKKVTEWAQKAVDENGLGLFKQNEVSIRFDKAHTSLTGSFSYPIGLKIKNLKLSFKHQCRVYDVSYETVVIPFGVRKALKREIDLGLLKLFNGQVQSQSDCEELETSPLLRAQDVEIKVFKSLKAVAKLGSKLDSRFLERLYIKGVLLYGTRLSLKGSDIEIDRLKLSLGEGSLLSHMNVQAVWKMEQSESQIKMSTKLSKDRLSAHLNLSEKEGVATFHLEAPFTEKEPVQLDLNMRHMPLSFLARWGRFNFAGLNLRTNWLDAELSLKVSDSLDAILKSFYIYGDLGKLKLHTKGFQAIWDQRSWSQKGQAQLNVSEVNLEHILYQKFRDKTKSFVGKFGKFKSVLKLQNLKDLAGDFELSDWTFLLRSMGKVDYQKVSHARGTLTAELDQSFRLEIDDVSFDQGEFQGVLSLDYQPRKDFVKLEFDVPVFKINPDVVKSLTALKMSEALSLKGGGYVSKDRLKGKGLDFEEEPLSKRKEVKLEVLSPSLSSKFWTASEARLYCELNYKMWDCRTRLQELSLSKEAAGQLNLVGAGEAAFESLEGALSFDGQSLDVSLQSSKAFKIQAKWTKETGPSLSCVSNLTDSCGREVFLRGL